MSAGLAGSARHLDAAAQRCHADHAEVYALRVLAASAARAASMRCAPWCGGAGAARGLLMDGLGYGVLDDRDHAGA